MLGRHHHNHDDDASARSIKPLLIALTINSGFFVIELIGALLSNSLALLADAAHMLTDSASLGLALFVAWVALKPPDVKRTYGYHRAEVVGALLNGLFLLGVVGYILFDAYRRFQNPRPVEPGIVVIVGIAGLGANLAAASFLSGHRDILNVEGAFIHLLADAAGSVAAITAGIVIWATGIYLVDPIIAVIIAVLVVYSMWDLLTDSLNILLQGTPRGIDVTEVSRALDSIEGVIDVHHLHIWALDSTRTALSTHVVAMDDVDTDDILARCRRVLTDRFEIDHATIQIESGDFSETVDMECYPTTEP